MHFKEGHFFFISKSLFRHLQERESKFSIFEGKFFILGEAVYLMVEGFHRNSEYK